MRIISLIKVIPLGSRAYFVRAVEYKAAKTVR